MLSPLSIRCMYLCLAACIAGHDTIESEGDDDECDTAEQHIIINGHDERYERFHTGACAWHRR